MKRALLVLLLTLTLSACLVEGRCVVEVAELAPPAGKAASVELKVTSGLIDPKKNPAAGVIEALAPYGEAALRAALALLL